MLTDPALRPMYPALLVLAVQGALAGCYGPSAREGAPCETSDQCPTPQRCVLGSCSLREAPPDAASDASPDAPIDAPPPPIDAMPCSTAGLTCGGTLTMFTCGGNCWVRCDDNVSHETARVRCEAWKGVIGEINSDAEQTCADMNTNTVTWIGLRQSDLAMTPREGWTWNGNGQVVYTHWLNGKPDDGDNNENNAEQCASMRLDGFWDDNSCSSATDFFCERPQ